MLYLRGKQKTARVKIRMDLNSGRLRLCFWDIYLDLLSAFAAVKKQAGSLATWEHPRQEEATGRTGKPSLICLDYTTTVRIFQQFSFLLFKVFKLIYTTPRLNLIYLHVCFRQHRHHVAEAAITVFTLR